MKSIIILFFLTQSLYTLGQISINITKNETNNLKMQMEWFIDTINKMEKPKFIQHVVYILKISLDTI